MKKSSEEKYKKQLKASIEWKRRNKEKNSLYMKAWRDLNKDFIKKSKKEWDLNNIDSVKEYRKIYYKQNKMENPNYHYNKHLKENYGITIEDYNMILEKQGFQCDVCGRKPEETSRKRLFVDHCHETGSIRGLLCQQCNTALGMVNDEIEKLYKLAAYIIKTTNLINAKPLWEDI